MKKKIAVLLSGLARCEEENFKFLKNLFKDYDFKILPLIWKNQKNLDSFKRIYFLEDIKEIEQNNWSYEISKIKYVFGEENRSYKLENIFHMWHSFSEGCKEIKNFSFKNKPDFVLRFRSDILPKYNETFINCELKKKQVLIPDRYHWNGINDQLFLFSFSDLEDFISINDYIINYQKKNLLFSSELIFQRFLKEKKIKIKFNKYNYNLMRKENKNNNSLKDKINVRLGLYDRITIKLNKFMFRLRNFNDFYLKKNMRNNQQDIII